MINWIAGHNSGQKYKSDSHSITHARIHLPCLSFLLTASIVAIDLFAHVRFVSAASPVCPLTSACSSRFKALVCHDGMFDIRTFYYATEELWFPEHDMQGLPWVNPENYEQFNPAQPELIAKWNTPMLIIHVSAITAHARKQKLRVSRLQMRPLARSLRF
jgi:hypothetical protein